MQNFCKRKRQNLKKTYKGYKNIFNKLIKKAKNSFYIIKVIKMSRKYKEIMANNEKSSRQNKAKKI